MGATIMLRRLVHPSSSVLPRRCCYSTSTSTASKPENLIDPAIRHKTLVGAHSSPKSKVGVVDYPPISGLSEVHIFLNPLQPDKETLQRYDDAVEEWNRDVLPTAEGAISKMRPVFLCLNFREAGEIFVMQSARHVSHESNDFVIEEAYKDGRWFAERGLEVTRHKVEAYGGSQGVPLTDEEALRYPNRYWEFHLRVNRAEDSADKAITTEEVQALKELSEFYTQELKIPVPLSYNAYKGGRQRFLNIRVGHCGRDTALKSVEYIKKDIATRPDFKYLHVGKAHTEYVWFDDNRDLDRGWIDFNQAEQQRWGLM